MGPAITARIVLGPLTLKQYLDFLPIGSAYKPLRDLDRILQPARDRFRNCSWCCSAKKPPEVLLDYAGLENEPMLGWTTWSKNAPMTRDPADAVLGLG